MIFLSLVLVIVAAVTLVLGVFQDGLVLIYVSIATCVAAMAVLGVGVLMRRREEATAGPASYGDATGPRDAAVARTPVSPLGQRERTSSEASAAPAEDDARRTAVVRKVDETPTVAGENGDGTGDDHDDDRAFRRPSAEEPRRTEAPVAAASAVTAAAAAGREDDVDEAEASVRPVAKRAVVKRTSERRDTEPVPRPSRSPTEAAEVPPAEEPIVAEPATVEDTADDVTGAEPAASVGPEVAASSAAPDAVAGRSVARKATAKKATAKKATAKKATAKKATAKKATAKKATAKKGTAKKAAGREATTSAAAGSGRSIADLRSVRGLGPAKRDKLIERFGSVDGLAAATVSEISAVPGVGVGTAQAIKDALG